jgi:hypothetical protein
MRSFKLFLMLSILGMGALLVSVPASADSMIVRNATSTLFSDNFQGLGTAVSHAVYPDASGDFDPTGGSPGSWTIGEGTSPENVQMTDYVDPAAIGEHYGADYLRIVRPVGGSGSAQVNFAAQSTGSQLHLETMLRMGAPNTSPGSSAGQIVGETTGAWPINVVAGLYNGGDKVWYYHGGWVDTGLTYAENTWQKWQIDWTVGSATFAIKIDGATAASLTADTGSVVSDFWFGPGESCTMYVGAMPIPEPCVVTLASSGLLGLLAYAWRKRR